jgi:ATP-dependent Clp protease, protease subunit
MNFKEIMARALQAKDGKAHGLQIRAMDDDATEVEVMLYDAIGYWGVTSAQFRTELNGIEADTIHLRLDCPGGDVFMARAMKTALEQHSARIVVHIDGVAASAASYLMMGGDEIEIAQGAQIMIHNAWGWTIGDNREHQKGADLLSKIDGGIRKDYAAKTGKSENEFIELMNEETWFEADEALDAGLVDRVYDKQDGANNRFDLTIYKNAPKKAPPASAPDDGDKAVAAHRAAQMRKLEFFERVAP